MDNDYKANVKLAYRHLEDARKDIKSITKDTNVKLAYRHLEDASMRLGKAMQAFDGGVSVYDKESTVGVDDDTGKTESSE